MSTAKSCLLAFCLITLAIAYPVEENDLDTKIIGGKRALQGEYPFLVSLQYMPNPTETVKFCGGSIIADKWVLTAAHCVDEDTSKGTKFYVAAGNVNAFSTSDSVQFVKVKKAYKHPGFKGGISLDDIALLELETAFKFGKLVQPINLPHQGYIPTGEGDIVGWGATANPAPDHQSDFLMAVHVKITPLEECKKELSLITENHVCPGELGKTSCAGDSGSPLVQIVRGKKCVTGVDSYGQRPCGNVAEAYTRVSAYIDSFINPTMKHK